MDERPVAGWQSWNFSDFILLAVGFAAVYAIREQGKSREIRTGCPLNEGHAGGGNGFVNRADRQDHGNYRQGLV